MSALPGDGAPMSRLSLLAVDVAASTYAAVKWLWGGGCVEDE